MTFPRTVLVTGSAGGIGRALALQYARSGQTLVLHGRTEAGLQDLAALCREQGADVDLLAHDLVDADGWMRALAQADARRPIDLAFVNAGVATVQPDALESWPSTTSMLDVNLRAAIATANVLAGAMQARRSGHIVLVSSLAADVGMALTPVYCATKAGLSVYGDALRGRLAADGIRVTVVQPGFVRSAMSARYPGPQPQLLSAEAAARRICAALPRNPARLRFPRPLSWGLQALALLPVDWGHAILRWSGYGPQPGTGTRNPH